MVSSEPEFNEVPKPVTAEVRLTHSADMGIFLHVTKKDGSGSGLRLDGTMLEGWARELLALPRNQ